MRRYKMLLAAMLFTLCLCFSDTVKAENTDIVIVSENEIPLALSDDFDKEDYMSVDSAADFLRKNMVNRKTNISVKVRSSLTDPNKLVEELLSAVYEENGASAQEGDYLRQCVLSRGASLNYYTVDSDMYYTIALEFTYCSNRTQEEYVTSNVKRIVSSLGLVSKQDDEKVKLVYDYVTSHVTYDYQSSGNPQAHSAYNALAKGKAVCQGYSSLVYRLLREAGVPVRVITGTSKGQNHAWNIVKLNGMWYNLDATWDSTLAGGNDQKYEYFLKSNQDFPDHTRNAEFLSAEFVKNHPVSSTSYGKYQPFLGKVTGLKVSSITGTSAKLSWTSQAHAQKYKVYRYNTSDGKYYLTNTTAASSVTVKNLKYATTYRFIVCAFHEKYGDGIFSNALSFTTSPAKPAISGLTTSSGKIKVTWKKISPCAGYQVQYSTSKTFASSASKAYYVTKNSTVSKTLSSLKKGKRYYVRVRAYITVNGKKQFGSWSSTKYIVCK